MRRVVVALICAAAVAEVPGIEARPPTLLQTASARSGLPIHARIRTLVERRARFDSDVARALGREYPPALTRTENAIDAGLGLGGSELPLLLARAQALRAWYDPRARALRVRRSPAPNSAQMLEQLVRALAFQNYGVRRLDRPRVRDRDAALAAAGVLGGLASFIAHTHASRTGASATPLGRFLAAEENIGSGPGRAFVSTLRNVGGAYAVKTALRTVPSTSEQLLHVDKFIEHERAEPVNAPAQIGEATLQATETFGELDIRALLDTFGVHGAAGAADGWAGGKALLYARPSGAATVAIAVRWDSDADSNEWLTAVSAYVAAAFPTARPESCPAVRACWTSGDRELAIARSGRTTALGSGADGELAAAVLSGSG